MFFRHLEFFSDFPAGEPEQKGRAVIRRLDYVIPDALDGVSVEHYLMRTHGYSRRIITQLKREPEHILRNGVHVRMVDRVCAGDRITVILAEERLLRANPLLQVGIVYEDADLILFDKPPAMPVHPSFAHANDTLGNFFAFHTQSRGERISFRPVNRLDADTTGLCLVAKNPLAASALAQQVQKEYTAVLCGEPVQDSGEINLPIARDPSNPVRRCVSKEGQPSVTRYEVLNRKMGILWSGCSLSPGAPTRFGSIFPIWDILWPATACMGETAPA